jgi:Mg2+/citrate symporter
LPSTPVFDWFKIQPVKMINLLLQNNINLSVLCWFGAYRKTAEVLMVEYTENQFISLPARQVTGSLSKLMIKKVTFGDNG